MLDRQSAKAYRKLVCESDPYKRFELVEQMDPNTAKRVLMTVVMKQGEKKENDSNGRIH
ncbi:hypothetical protein ACFSCX_06465 [Bacillus salitolerans]|uniref:Uncharacterized protein n=1 Tax=Bacillus salitolerans TaxID=1437434 RepID=A0ABW4LMR8_9BACI